MLLRVSASVQYFSGLPGGLRLFQVIGDVGVIIVLRSGNLLAQNVLCRST
jgi:hypothetical protein